MPKRKTNNRSKSSKLSKKLLGRIQNRSRLQMIIFIIIFGGIGTYAIIQSLAAGNNYYGFSWNPSFSNINDSMDTDEPSGHYPRNTTGCAWNDENQIVYSGSGDISSSTSNKLCLVADYDDNGPSGAYPKTIIYKVYAPSNTLSVTLANDVGDRWNSPPAIKSGNQYLYQLCVEDPVAEKGEIGLGDVNGLNHWPEIPNTNNGRGQIVNYTITLTNLGRSTMHKVTASWEVGINGNARGGLMANLQTQNPVPCPPQDGFGPSDID
ncbi:MAG TPA: hypothetical protein VLF79_02600 [Candidatus Saccharimonadales bacterium]|nr:hypothetical protein [Candidatus Saccharimonadales bacterium]